MIITPRRTSGFLYAACLKLGRTDHTDLGSRYNLLGIVGCVLALGITELLGSSTNDGSGARRVLAYLLFWG